MYLLDTDLLIWVIRGNQKVIKAIDELTSKSPTHVSTVSIAEIYKNVFPSETIRTNEVIYSYELLPLDDISAKQAGFYWRDYVARFRNLSITDCMISATAKRHDLVLLTTNTCHFPMTDIEVLNPLK